MTGAEGVKTVISQVPVIISDMKTLLSLCKWLQREGDETEHLIPDPLSAPIPFGAPG